MLSFTELLEGFVEPGFITLCALIAPLAYLVLLDVQKCLPRAPTPGDASDKWRRCSTWGPQLHHGNLLLPDGSGRDECPHLHTGSIPPRRTPRPPTGISLARGGKLQLWFHSECASFKRVLTSNSQPHRDTLRSVTVGPKDTSLSITRMEPPDAAMCAKGSDTFK